MNTSLKATLFYRGLIRRRTPGPIEVQAEITNRCNLACVMCPGRLMDLPQEDMPGRIFEEVVRNLHGVRYLGLTGWGEPLAHPRLLDFIHMAKTAWPDLKVRLTTNGLMLSAEMARELIRAGVDRIAISLDRVEGEHGPGHEKPSQVQTVVEGFLKARGSAGRPTLVLQTTLHKGGLEDVLEVVRFAIWAGADAVNLVRLDNRVVPLARPSASEERMIVKQARKVGKGRVASVNRRSLPVFLATRGDSVCLRTLYHVYIDVRGNVSPCCLMREAVMGNIMMQPLDQIWRSEKFTRFFREQGGVCGECDALRIRHRRPDTP